MYHMKVVIVGDGAIGKTSLLISYSTGGGFPRDYQPTVCDNFSCNQMYKGMAFNIGLWDTAGQEDFDRIRHHSYSDADVVLMCYSVVNPSSFQNVLQKWMPEIKHYTSNVPVILVGTQTDMRDDKSVVEYLALKKLKPVTFEDGLLMQKRIGALSFSECSVKSEHGVEQLFNEAISIYIQSNTEGGHHRRRRGNSTKHIKKDKERDRDNCVL
ncbi:hypothetical protein SAMD00019534_046390, partial [Acytostelium subglobosum LB1]|uniref:hypothetical protein n=1 Tax=Acytostelium subglobosum LB1 TaxID=1410327 RepID=UPI000644B46B